MSQFSIELVDESLSATWDQMVENHPGGSFFHLDSWLRLVETETGYRLFRLFIKEKNRPVGLVPVFMKRKGGVNLCLSPPPGMSTPSMGPLLDVNARNQYEREKRLTRQSEALFEYLRDELKADFIRFKCVSSMDDVRPLQWAGFRCEPRYTYTLDITTPDKAFSEFDGRIRTGFRKASANRHLTYRHDVGLDGAIEVLATVSERYEEQGLHFPLGPELIARMLSGPLKSFLISSVVEDDAGFVTGNIYIAHKAQVHHWIGGTTPRRNHPGVNEWLHFSAIERFAKRGFIAYEFMGANTKHLCDHKSKYNPEPVVYYEATWKNARGMIVQAAMKWRNG